MIVIGYPGIGKTSTIEAKETICGKPVIDLESSNFWVTKPGTEERRRPDYWYKIYAQIAADLSRQGFVVFLSSHKDVREELKDKKYEDVQKLLAFPDITIKDEWVERLKNRFDRFPNKKNEYALFRAQNYYDLDIRDMMSGSGGDCFFRLVLSSPYKLSEAITTFAYAMMYPVTE